MKILFLNGSANKDGNTVRLAKALLEGKSYQQLDLVDYKIYAHGQDFEDDQLADVIDEMKAADTIVLGSPLYWHNMSGIIRNLMDRTYGTYKSGLFDGKRLFFLFQGFAPTQEMISAVNYTVSRFSQRYGMDYVGMATSIEEATALSAEI